MIELQLFDAVIRNYNKGKHATDTIIHYGSNALTGVWTSLILRWKQLHANGADIVTKMMNISDETSGH
jgi:hypothetical protein